MRTSRTTSAFTLIELLVVIGIFAVMAGVIGFALCRANPPSALRAGQGIIASLLSAARTKAMLTQGRVVLAIDADARSGEFLRRIGVAVESIPDSGKWLLVDDGELLPAGIFMVPGETNIAGVEFDFTLGPWPEAAYSALRLATAGEVVGASGTASSFLVAMNPFDTSGTTGVNGERWVVAAGRRTSAGVVFENPKYLRGILLGVYGVALSINEAAGFEL